MLSDIYIIIGCISSAVVCYGMRKKMSTWTNKITMVINIMIFFYGSYDFVKYSGFELYKRLFPLEPSQSELFELSFDEKSIYSNFMTFVQTRTLVDYYRHGYKQFERYIDML